MFWLGWGKKLKETVSKTFIRNNYLNKVEIPLQSVRSKIDFYDNVVAKREAFVDVVGNGPTNIPNLSYLKQQDTLGCFRIFIKDFDNGRWDIEWIKKPTLWNDNDVAVDEIHINTTRLENNVVTFNDTNGFQGWNNVRIPATAQTNQLNNAHFKDITKPTFMYVFMRLNAKLGGRVLKRVIPTSFGFEKQWLEMEFVVNYTPTTKDIKDNIKVQELKESFNTIGGK